MAKEDREERSKLEVQLKEMTDKVKPLEKELEVSKKSLERAEKGSEKLNEQIDKLEKNLAELKKTESENKFLKQELERKSQSLNDIQKDQEAFRELKKANDALKVVCLEQQDQGIEYENIVTKLQANLETLTKAKEKFEKEAAKLSQASSELRIEKNELKSKLIFTETQLREFREKHADVEHLYKEEEKSWNDQMSKMSNVKNEQSEALAKVKTQLSVLAKNYEILSDDSAELRDQNLQLKEEMSQYITNIQSLKESNFKLHQVMEETMAKIERRNMEIANLSEKYERVKEDKEKRDNENSIHIDQLKKLIDHLRAKIAELESGVKKSSKKRPLQLSEPTLSDDYFKTRTPLKSPPKKVFK